MLECNCPAYSRLPGTARCCQCAGRGVALAGGAALEEESYTAWIVGALVLAWCVMSVDAI